MKKNETYADKYEKHFPKVNWKTKYEDMLKTLDDMDEDLMFLEDHMHGEEGKVITKLRGKISKVVFPRVH